MNIKQHALMLTIGIALITVGVYILVPNSSPKTADAKNDGDKNCNYSGNCHYDKPHDPKSEHENGDVNKITKDVDKVLKDKIDV
jgi:hypothetical protein